jgi:hypothetical protein
MVFVAYRGWPTAWQAGRWHPVLPFNHSAPVKKSGAHRTPDGVTIALE